MCGIIGLVGRADPDTVDRALDTLAHRGPDGRGVYQRGEVVLGHRRLSILDLAGGAQPMVGPSQDLAIVFNGEIYNHLDLRRDLAQRGHSFSTTSDTETLLAMYREYGEACVDHLRGMYAFVVHDARRNLLFGARDPFGKKPLYWRTGAGIRFAFASEPRALLALWPDERPAISTEGVVSYLLHDYVTGAHSAYDGVQRIPPGTAFRVELDGAMPALEPVPRTFWSPRTSFRAPPSAIAEADAVAQLDVLLRTAVERRLLADVPLGVLLSGGIDSSVTAYLASQIAGRDQVQSFAIGFRDRRFDESRYAADVAEAVGTRHRCRFFDAADVLQAVDTVVHRLDEPFADPSVLPTLMLSQFAREYVTVALGGDGGDELFAGYDTFAAIAPAALARAVVPAFADGMLEHALGLLPADSGSTHMPLEFKARRFLRGYRLRGAAMLTAWHGPFDAAGLDRLLSRDLDWRQFGLTPGTSSDPDDGDVTAALAWYQSVYLPDDILVKGDRASMLHSLELRSPFLDLDVAEYVNALPPSLKLHGRVRKYLLRALIRQWERQGQRFPSHVLGRAKKGFGIPVGTWLRGPLRGLLERAVVEEWPDALAFVQAEERHRLVGLHLSGAQNLSKELWALLMLSCWARTWIR